MKKFMVVYQTEEDGTCAAFFDGINEAEAARMNIAVAMGWEAEVYERINREGGPEYVLLYA